VRIATYLGKCMFCSREKCVCGIKN